MINPRLSYTGIPRSGLTHKFDRRDLTVQKKKSPTDDSEKYFGLITVTLLYNEKCRKWHENFVTLLLIQNVVVSYQNLTLNSKRSFSALVNV